MVAISCESKAIILLAKRCLPGETNPGFWYPKETSQPIGVSVESDFFYVLCNNSWQ